MKNQLDTDIQTRSRNDTSRRKRNYNKNISKKFLAIELVMGNLILTACTKTSETIENLPLPQNQFTEENDKEE